MKPQIIEIQETRLTVSLASIDEQVRQGGDKLQYVIVRAWDTPSYVRYKKITNSSIRAMERSYQTWLRAAN